MVNRKCFCILVFWEAEISMVPVEGTSVGAMFVIMCFGLGYLYKWSRGHVGSVILCILESNGLGVYWDVQAMPNPVLIHFVLKGLVLIHFEVEE